MLAAYTHLNDTASDEKPNALRFALAGATAGDTAAVAGLQPGRRMAGGGARSHRPGQRRPCGARPATGAGRRRRAGDPANRYTRGAGPGHARNDQGRAGRAVAGSGLCRAQRRQGRQRGHLPAVRHPYRCHGARYQPGGCHAGSDWGYAATAGQPGQGTGG